MTKILFFLTILSFPFCIFGQELSDKVWNYSCLIENTISDIHADTLLQVPVINVKLKNKDNEWENRLVFINKICINPSLVRNTTILPLNIIEKVFVSEYVTVQGINYKPYYFSTKDNYFPKSISLSRIKQKYTNLDDAGTTLFLLNGSVIFTNNYDDFMIDENNLSKIEIKNSINNVTENFNFKIINLFTQIEPYKSSVIINENDLKERRKIKMTTRRNEELSYFDLRGNFIEDIKKDTLLKVSVIEKIEENESFATLNTNLLISSSFLFEDVLNRTLIENSNCYGEMILDSQKPIKTYHDITLKEKLYIPKVISLSNIKKKYSELKAKPTLFLINGKLIITDNYENFKVDEKNLLRIEVYESFKNVTDNFDIGVIDLITKENLKKEHRNEIY